MRKIHKLLKEQVTDCTDKMRRTNRICAHERRDSPIRPWLLEANCCNKAQSTPCLTDGWAHWLPWHGEAAIQSTLNADCGSLQMEIGELHQNKTAYTYHHGLYQFICLLFVLWNAPETSQRTMDVILASVNWHFVLVFMDEIFIFFETSDKRIAISEKF